MTIKSYSVILCVILALFTAAAGQTSSDPEMFENQISDLEGRNINDFSASLKRIYEESLVNLYRSYLTSLNRQLELLENIPDPTGEFAKKRSEYVKKRDATATKLDIVEGHLRITGSVSPAESQTGKGTSDRGRVDSAADPGRFVDKPKLAPPDERREVAATKEIRKTKPATFALQPPSNASPACPETIVVGSIDSSTNAFTDAPKIVKDEAETAAREIVEQIDLGPNADEQPVTAALRHYSSLYFQSVARSIEAEGDTQSAIVNLEPLRYLPETYRTDKQIGATSGNSAATSSIDKPGFAWLLGFAIENGYVEKNVQDTVLTLSTSPAVLFAAKDRNFNAAYQNAGFLNRFGLSASFNINSDNPLLSNVNRTQLRDYSIRFRFLGDHSANSRRLQRIWDETIAPKIRAQLVAVGQVREFVDNTQSLRDLRNCTEEAFIAAFGEKIKSQQFKSLAAERRVADLTNFYLNFMKVAVADRVRSGQTSLDASVKGELRARMTNLLEVQKNFAYDVIKEELDKFFKRPIGTFAYINHRDPLGNYSEFKALYQQTDSFLKPLTLTANAGYSFYHRPNAALNQQKTRDFNFALSFEGKTDSPFAEDGDFSQITYAFTGRYVRFLENQSLADRKADLLSAQFLLTVPLFRGFILPVSVTYSNATELDRRAGVRFNFGFKLDTEKLFALARKKTLF